jgi:hypothetical protein
MVPGDSHTDYYSGTPSGPQDSRTKKDRVQGLIGVVLHGFCKNYWINHTPRHVPPSESATLFEGSCCNWQHPPLQTEPGGHFVPHAPQLLSSKAGSHASLTHIVVAVKPGAIADPVYISKTGIRNRIITKVYFLKSCGVNENIIAGCGPAGIRKHRYHPIQV